MNGKETYEGEKRTYTKNRHLSNLSINIWKYRYIKYLFLNLVNYNFYFAWTFNVKLNNVGAYKKNY